MTKHRFLPRFQLPRPDARVTDLARLAILGALLALPVLATAYPGEQLVSWARETGLAGGAVL